MGGNAIQMRGVYDLLEEPRGSTYRELLAFLAPHAQTALLVVRDQEILQQSAQGILDELHPHLLKEEARGEWPGTRLMGHTATVYIYSVDQSIVDTLSDAVEGLYCWEGPDRPEDLCLLRSDDSPILVTIAHEHDAYLELTKDEFQKIRLAIPDLSIRLPH